MELKDLLPLGGVVVGWFLKELSDFFRRNSETRAMLGTALLGLLELDAELGRLSIALDIQKNRPITWEEYEKIRRATASRYLARIEPTKAVEAARAAMARLDPLQASQLRELPALLEMFQSTSLQSLSSDADTEQYIKWLSVLEVSVDLVRHALKRTLLKLAWLHGPTTWLRIRWNWRRRKPQLAAKNWKSAEEMILEFYARADSAQSDASSVQPASPPAR